MSTEEKEQAIVRATDYIDQRFGRKFVGQKTHGDQALEWPRASAYDRDDHVLSDIPVLLQRACAEYALIAYRQGELAPQPPLPVPSLGVDGTAGSTEATGQIIKEKVGPIETEYKVDSVVQSRNSTKSALVSDSNIPEYPVADMWIAELLRSSSSRTLVRA
jgi:predicted amidohydrolase YtcJ